MSADENNASVEFMVALKLRDFAGLQKRIARGEIISDAEFDALYMPLDTDYQSVRAWAIGQGLTIVNPDQNRMGLFLSGSAAQVKQALQVSLAKVSFDAWQTGSGVPSGTDRLVPDVALPADPSTGCLVVLNGSSLQYGAAKTARYARRQSLTRPIQQGQATICVPAWACRIWRIWFRHFQHQAAAEAGRRI